MSQGDIMGLKQEIRERVWEEMERKGVASLPLPIRGRVPNFTGSARAAMRIREMKEYASAEVVMVNPDAPQHPVRRISLQDGKKLLMATPALKKGLILIEPEDARDPFRAATIQGAMRCGKPVDLRLLKVDLIVEGSVAVDPLGGRVGKGSGWGDLEYAVLRESGAADENVRVVTTVHDLQVIEGPIPMEPHDMPVDTVLTPTRRIETARVHPKPGGIIWEKLDGAKTDLIRRALGSSGV